MTKWHAHVVLKAKHITMVGGPFLVGGPGPGPLAPLNLALLELLMFSIDRNLQRF